jgi:hypothetical protein
MLQVGMVAVRAHETMRGNYFPRTLFRCAWYSSSVIAPWSLAFFKSINSWPRVGFIVAQPCLSPPICQAHPENSIPRTLAITINPSHFDIRFIITGLLLSSFSHSRPRAHTALS